MRRWRAEMPQRWGEEEDPCPCCEASWVQVDKYGWCDDDDVEALVARANSEIERLHRRLWEMRRERVLMRLIDQRAKAATSRWNSRSMAAVALWDKRHMAAGYRLRMVSAMEYNP